MIAAWLAVTAVTAVAGGATADPTAMLNDYPTEARAGYVFTCMASNGQTRKALSECSCAIDHIAAVLPYDGYVSAETVLAMRQTTGARTEVFRNTTFASDFVKHLQTAEAEAEILCFTPGN